MTPVELPQPAPPHLAFWECSRDPDISGGGGSFLPCLVQNSDPKNLEKNKVVFFTLPSFDVPGYAEKICEAVV